MPKKDSAYTRNKAFVDQLRASGKSWREVGKAAKEAGIKEGTSGIHKAYNAYYNRGDDKEEADANKTISDDTLEGFIKKHHPKIWAKWKKHCKSRGLQQEKTTIAEEIKAAKEEILLSQLMQPNNADIIEKWCQSLSFNNPELVKEYIRNCRGQPFEKWYDEFSKLAEQNKNFDVELKDKPLI